MEVVERTYFADHEPAIRPTVRVLLFDKFARVLLLRGDETLTPHNRTRPLSALGPLVLFLL